MNSPRKKLAALRKAMKEAGVDACIIPASDPHLGEYVPEHWRVIMWLTGFTGSAATVVVTRKFAGLWTDSRYFIQAANQLKNTGYELVRLRVAHSPEYIEWLAENLKKGDRIAVDGRLLSVDLFRILEKATTRKNIIVRTDLRLVEALWEDRPPMPQSVAYDHPLRYCGLDRQQKIRHVREKMDVIGADHHLLTSPDDIMWMLNIRGADVEYSPLLSCFSVINPLQVLLFVDEEKIPGAMRTAFDRENIVLLPYDDVATILGRLPHGSRLLINPAAVSASLFRSLSSGTEIIEDITIPTRLKAIKNSTEIANIRETMIRDGVALTRFFRWLEAAVPGGDVTEMSAADRLLDFRMEQEGFRSLSFNTISAWNEHAALPHYSPSVDTDSLLGPEGIYLLDSGGQYFGGTTDITRCVVFGEPTERQKEDFTLALKGTIGLASARFPLGTRGYQLEILARKALWDHGLNYGHGTGHGVGFFLNVHEGPQTIGSSASGDLKTIIEPGMLISDEPAVYRADEYGFRTENLMVCIDDVQTGYGQFLRFDTVTLCYIDARLIDMKLLTDEEIRWLDDYHAGVYSKLAPLLDKETAYWLAGKTVPLGKK